MQNKKLVVKAVLFGILCAMLISVAILCVFSAVVLSSGLLPGELTNIITIASLAVGTFAGGFIAARITKSAVLIVGLVTGFTVFMIITVIGLIKSSESMTYLTIVRFLSTLITGAIGGIIGVNKRDKLSIK